MPEKFRQLCSLLRRVIDFSKASGNLKGAIDQVIADADYKVMVRRFAPDAVVISLDTLVV